MLNAKTYMQARLEDGQWTCGAGRNHYIEWVSEYAEGQGYNTPETGILFADWNECSTYVTVTPRHDNAHGATVNGASERIVTCSCMPRIAKIAESLGYEIEWEDEWLTCSGCCKALRTSPDSYGWNPAYWMGDGEILCNACVDPHEVVRDCMNDPTKAVAEIVDLAKCGYVPAIEEQYESGLHPGQDDDPRDVAKRLEDGGVKRFVFQITGRGQFETRFAVYVRKRDVRKAERLLTARTVSVRANEMYDMAMDRENV